MAESWTERARRRERDRKRREEERRRRQMRRLLDPAQYARMGKRAAKKALKDLTGPARRQARQAYRSRFRSCPTCAQPDTPGHTCRMRFRERNAVNLRKRMDQRGTEQYENLWRGRRAA